DGGDTLRWFNEDLEFVGQGDTLEVLVNFTQNFFVESVIERGDKRCEALQPVEVFVKNPLSQFDPEKVISKIYPNPANELLMVQLKQGLQVESFELFDVNGRRLQSLPFEEQASGNYSLFIEQFSSGVYSLRIRHADGLVAAPFVIAR
ncbi:MAG: T9SS type A sorting domain-containing protein, partial [Bacteroidota bacterium]